MATSLESFAITGFFNGVPCVGVVSKNKRGFIAECFRTDDYAENEHLGNPAFFISYEEAVQAVKGAMNA